MTSSSSEELRIPLKNEHAENVNQGKRDFNVGGWEGDKTQGFRFLRLNHLRSFLEIPN